MLIRSPLEISHTRGTGGAGGADFALDRWGERHTWTVVWKARRLARDWRAPAYAAIPGTFLSAVGLWAHSAIANGAPIRLIEYRANNTLVVESTNGDDNGF